MVAKSNVEPIRLTEIGDDRRIRAKDALREAKTAKLDEVLVIGRTNEGELWATSSLNGGQSLWLLEKLRERILAGNPWSLV